MKSFLYILVLQAALSCSLAAQTHLDIQVPSRVKAELRGPVKQVVTHHSYDGSDRAFREVCRYDETGNLLSWTHFDPDDNVIYAATNAYNESGCLVHQWIEDVRAGSTNDYEVILSVPTRKIAYRCSITGKIEIHTFNKAGHLVSTSVKRDGRNIRQSMYMRAADNRKQQFTYYNARGSTRYRIKYKWENDRQLRSVLVTDREKETRDLILYDYLKIDSYGNWTQCRAEYLDDEKSNLKRFERQSTRTIEYHPEPAAHK